jgi:poly-gamma-glutamate synthesis protein (capsule biosynthesis protein)
MFPYRFSVTARLLFINAAIFLCLGCHSSHQPVVSTSTTEPSKRVETRVTFLAVGDIMLSRGVAQRIGSANDPLLPFRHLETLLKSTDFNFGNLESPVSGRDQVLGHDKIFNTKTRDIEGLTEYNFKVLNLANNHAFDQGLAGLRSTRKDLEDRGITYLGAGDDLKEAWQPKVFIANNLRIGFIGASYASVNDGGVVRNDYIARIEDLDNLKEAISQLRSRADFIVVTMHAGTEFVDKADERRTLDKRQIDFAHAAIDYGADLVIGAHPHWIQNFETYSGKYIFYSLGNFVFDMYDPTANEGLVLKVTLRGEKKSSPSAMVSNDSGRVEFTTQVEQIECLPVIVENHSTPRLASEEEAARILTRLNLKQKIVEPQ